MLQAFGQLWTARRALRKRPFRELAPVAGADADAAKPPECMPRDRECAADIGWAVRTAARYAPGDNTCLVQVLAARAMMQAAGIGGTIYIGAGQGDAADNSGFIAHAWLKCGDRFVTGEAGHERYTVLGEFSWQEKPKA